MDKTTKYRQLIKSLLAKYVELVLRRPDPKIEPHLTFDEFLKLSPEDQRNWRHRILINNKEWLNKQLKIHNAEWLLVLGGTIERTSSTLDNFPTKNEVYQLAEDKNFAPFIHVKDPQIEESKNRLNMV